MSIASWGSGEDMLKPNIYSSDDDDDDDNGNFKQYFATILY